MTRTPTQRKGGCGSHHGMDQLPRSSRSHVSEPLRRFHIVDSRRASDRPVACSARAGRHEEISAGVVLISSRPPGRTSITERVSRNPEQDPGRLCFVAC